jgi:predicted transcriptional regulator
MTTLTLKLPEALDEQLTTIAKRRRSSKTTLVLKAIEAYLAGQSVTAAPSKAPTVEELAGHLIGCIDVDGPTDLSTNKKYFEGFGE